jgi:uncharacterized membrane protein
MSQYFYPIIFLLSIAFSVGFEIILSKIHFHELGLKKKHQVVHFKLSRYFFLISMPILIMLLMSYLVSASILKYFIFFAAIGTILEYCIGYSYQMIVRQRLWTYNRYSIQGYTSLLSIPLWGLFGALLYLLAKTIS